MTEQEINLRISAINGELSQLSQVLSELRWFWHTACKGCQE